MAKYVTRQRKVLLDFLSRHRDQAISAKEIADALADQGISHSAVCRNLSQLEQEGTARRVSKAGSRSVFFQYMGDPACQGSLHLSCKGCGRMVHMNGARADRLLQVIALGEDFWVDKGDTVLCGLCGACQTR